jgi:hypothetical protein
MTRAVASTNNPLHHQSMRKLAAVEDAREIMKEAMDWSLWRWMLEKGRVRDIADRATAVLDRANQNAKAGWSDDLKRAYQELVEDGQRSRSARRSEHAVQQPALIIDPLLRDLAKQLKEADEAAERATLAAERTFDEADRLISTSMAREGARKALKSYDLRELAIRKSEAARQKSGNVALPGPARDGEGTLRS